MHKLNLAYGEATSTFFLFFPSRREIKEKFV